MTYKFLLRLGVVAIVALFLGCGSQSTELEANQRRSQISVKLQAALTAVDESLEQAKRDTEYAERIFIEWTAQGRRESLEKEVFAAIKKARASLEQMKQNEQKAERARKALKNVSRLG